MTTFMTSFWRVPMAMLALATLILVPVSMASAHGQGNEPHGRIHRLAPISVEITSISQNEDGSGTLLATFEKVPARLSTQTGADVGDAVTVTYTSQTSFKQEGEHATIDTFEVGDIIFVLGPLDSQTMTIDARRISNKPLRPLFQVGEVLSVDLNTNTIVVSTLRSNDGTESSILVSYDGQTVIEEDREDADETAISVGDKIHVRGEVSTDVEGYALKIDAQAIQLFDELSPRPLHRSPHTLPAL